MTTRVTRALATVALAGVATLQGCVTVRTPVFMRAPAEREWARVLPEARERIAQGEYPGADTLLASFVARHVGTREAADAAFWLGLARLDPRNANVSPETAAVAFGAHLEEAEGRHKAEAAALRRAALRVDSLQRDLASIAEAVRSLPERPPEAQPAPADAPASLEDEVRRLRAELARAHGELERIRRRLTSPARP